MRNPLVRRLLCATGVLILAACTSGTANEVTRTVPPVSTEPTSPATAAENPADDGPVALPAAPPGEAIVDGRANGLILVVDAGQTSLEIVQIDGTPVTTLSRETGEVILQPVWSPDGRRVAWARSADGIEWELAHAAVDGTDERTVPLPGRPDYLAFDPTSSRITALTPSPAGFGLVAVELAGADAVARVVDAGRPYFTDFSPDGERVVAHVGTEVRVLGVGDTAADPVSLADPSTTHQTPQWHPEEDLVVYTIDEDARGGQLVQHRVDDDESSPIAAFGGFVLFDLDPTGQRLAVSSFAAPSGSGTPQALVRQQDQLADGLSVIDLADSSSTTLSEEPTSAPLWDPTGTKVLVRDGLDGVGRWTVHHLDTDLTRTEITERYSVDGSQMPLYLRFWDQYVRTHTVWSPDGGHFLHVGAAADGRSGVWVHDAGTSGESAFLTPGDLALWSPT